MTINVEGMPVIEAGHIFWVLAFSVMTVGLCAVAWPHTPTYKDGLLGAITICFEAIGIELAHNKAAIIVPLAFGLVGSILTRSYLPETLRSGWKWLLFIVYFPVAIIVLLLAYRGWLDIFFLFPDVGK